MKSVALSDIVKFVSQTLDSYSYTDFNGALNGLQFENSGRVSKLAVAVDAGLYEFEKAREIGADLLLVHHGLYWDSPIPITDTNYKKIKRKPKLPLFITNKVVLCNYFPGVPVGILPIG